MIQSFKIGILASNDPLAHVVQHDFITIGGFVITNHMIMMFLAAVIMIFGFIYIARQKTMVPTGIKNFLEMLLVYIRTNVVRPVLGKDTDRFIKYLWTVFFFVLTLNLIGMVPMDGILFLVTGGGIDLESQHRAFGGTATANIWVTGTLAIISFFMIQVNGIREQGIGPYIKNFIPHVPWPLIPMMYVLEIVGALVKPFALAIRLFANMMAGHAVMGAMIGLIMVNNSYAIAGLSVVGCALFSVLEVFVAFLQAYIFTFLTTLFIGAAMHPEH
jgi:F-type H+-transporting ATPase subunit a